MKNRQRGNVPRENGYWQTFSLPVQYSTFLSPFVPSSFIKVYNLYSDTNILGDLGGYDHKLSIKVLTIPVMYLN